MKLTLTLATLILTAAALPSHFNVRDCTPAQGVATDGNQFWADNCDLGAGEGGVGQKMKRVVGALLGQRNWDDHNKGQQQQNNNNNGGHDANWNGVYEQTPGCTPGADGVATDGNQFWADNCDLGAGGR